MSADGHDDPGGDGQQDFQDSKAVLAFVEDLTRNADSVQEGVLAEILACNAETEYLRELGLCGKVNRSDEFKRRAPIVSHEDLQPFIRRIANGDTSPLLCAAPVTQFLTSSGTSGGERKLIPIIEDENERRGNVFDMLLPIMQHYIEGLDGKCMFFMFVKSGTKTPSGHSAMPAMTSYYKSKWFLRRKEVVAKQFTSPLEAVWCPDVVQSMYCQLVCGLLQRREVVRMGGGFASSFLRVMGFLQERWPQIVEDIKQKKLGSDTVVTDRNLREIVDAELVSRGGAAAAEGIERECAEANWQGILRRLWPRAKSVEAVVSGAMAQYVPALEFFAGGIPLVSMLYASSECFFGVNLAPLLPPSNVSYTLLPNLGYFEFLPLSEEPLPANLVALVDVQQGEQYEFVVTTYSGLYRYRVGDVLQVTGFHHKAPQFRFVRRENVLLTIDSDKTDEDTLHKAVTAACCNHLDAATSQRLVDYTSFADFSSNPGHYVLFWEIIGSLSAEQSSSCPPDACLPDARVFEDCCLAVEEGLDAVYRQCRVCDKSIGPLEIRLVRPGSFDALMDLSLTQGAFIGQYKTPRCVKQVSHVALLNSRVTHSYFSRKCPVWTPDRSDWPAYPQH